MVRHDVEGALLCTKQTMVRGVGYGAEGTLLCTMALHALSTPWYIAEYNGNPSTGLYMAHSGAIAVETLDHQL